MSRKFFHLGSLAIAIAIAGCGNSQVGDPCSPEQVPAGGFLPTETYLETQSVQCASGTCLVRDISGDTNNLQEDGCPRGEETCILEEELQQNVYCTARCAGSSGNTVSCPGGFTCEEILETGGEGLRGSYCVRVTE